MKKRLLIVFFAVMPLTGWAQDSLSVGARTAARLNPLSGEAQTLLYNAAPSFTQVDAGYLLKAEDQAFLPQEGRGLGEFFVKADARHRLNRNTAVSGGASYRRGVKRGVFMNTSSDWEFLYPYHTADTVGGDLQKEQYSFNGAYVHRMGRWFVGGALDFRALHEYRSVDPRPRNITSDLNGSLTAGLEMGSHALSARLLLGIYHQSQDIEFIDPRGHNTSILHMTGLGQHYGRFSGSGSSTNARFRGLTAGAVLYWEPLSGQGAFARAEYTLHRYIRHIKNQNEAPMSRLYVHEVAASGGWKNGSRLYRGTLLYEYRRGLEAVLDVKGAYQSLIDLPLYGQHRVGARADAILNFAGASAQWSLRPQVGAETLQSANLNPYRALSLTAADAAVSASRLSRSGKWVFLLEGALDGHFTLAKNLSLPSEKTDPVLLGIYSALYGRWADHWGTLRLGTSLTRELSAGIALNFSLQAEGRLYATGHRMGAVTASLGLIF
ncbi:MAG: hypothetical protein J6M23_07135 [Bacteroidales bacterium]|nr:hypothetical protein [Bacteroidales bacterium]